MTEYWVSKTQYFCKYCNIYIRDDKPSRQQHENGLRHKGNLERYIRSVYKDKATKARDEAVEAREIARINAAAAAAHALDHPTAPPSAAGAPGDGKGKGKEPAAKWRGAANLANYSDARSLGLVDEAMEKQLLEEEARSGDAESRVGEWQAVRPLPRRAAPAEGEGVEEEEDQEERERRRPPSQRFRERVAPTDIFGDDDDAAAALPAIRLKRPRLNGSENGAGVKQEDGGGDEAAPAVVPGAFRAFRLDGGLHASGHEEEVPAGGGGEEVKREEDGLSAAADDTGALAAAVPAPGEAEEQKPAVHDDHAAAAAAPSLFKKRKAGGTRTGAARSTALV